MKIFFAIVLGGLLSFGGGYSLIYITRKTEMSVDTFNLKPERIVEDMQSRSVQVPPLGQLWAFAPDQKLNVTIVQKKPTEDGVIVSIKATAIAVIIPPKTTEDKEKGSPHRKPDTPPTPVTVNLNGIAKLTYESIGGEWCLLDITSVNLRAVQQK